MTVPSKKEKISPKILFFSSRFCEPCKSVENLIHKVNLSLFGKKLKIQKISIETKNPIIDKYNITSVPTLIIAGRKLLRNVNMDEIIDAILQGFISLVNI